MHFLFRTNALDEEQSDAFMIRSLSAPSASAFTAGRRTFGGEAHRDDLLCDVRKVEVESIGKEPALIRRYDLAHLQFTA